jgi:hypothetical protein
VTTMVLRRRGAGSNGSDCGSKAGWRSSTWAREWNGYETGCPHWTVVVEKQGSAAVTHRSRQEAAVGGQNAHEISFYRHAVRGKAGLGGACQREATWRSCHGMHAWVHCGRGGCLAQ